MVFGPPRVDVIRVVLATTCSPLTPWATSVASASRVNASTTVSAPQPPAVEQRVGNEVHRPHLGRRRHSGLPFAVGSADVATRATKPKAQSIFPMKPVDAFLRRTCKRQDAAKRLITVACASNSAG